VPGLKTYKYPVVATLESKQPSFSPLAISVPPLFPSVLALVLVVSLALVTIIHGLYAVITIVQVISIATYITISYLVFISIITSILILTGGEGTWISVGTC
jgi:hypothetical protein